VGALESRRQAAGMATAIAVNRSRLVSNMERDHRPNRLFRQFPEHRGYAM